MPQKLLRFFLFLFGLIFFLDGFISFLFKKIHLGTIIPFMLGIIFLCTALFWHKIHAYLTHHSKLYTFWKTAWVVFSIWFISLMGFFSYIHMNSIQTTSSKPVQAMIVLGSGITKGKPSSALAARLDRAAEVSIQQPQSLIIVSGGLDYGETITEASAMSQYLQERYNISKQRIFQETQSTSTELNLKNSQSLLLQQNLDLDSSIGIVTSDFHTLRAQAIAKKIGYTDITMIGAPTPLAIRYNAWLREYFAYLSGWLLKEY